MFRLPISVVLTAVAVLVIAVPALAQAPGDRAGRPYRGLFGGGPGNWDQSLSLMLSLGGGFDSRQLTDDAGGGLMDVNRQSAVADTSASLDYSIGRGRFGVDAQAMASGRYYPSQVDSLVSGVSAGGSGWIKLWRSTLRVTTGQIYRPFDGFALVQSGGTPAAGQVPINVLAADLHQFASPGATQLTASYGLDLSQAISTRSAISGGFHVDRTKFSGVGAQLTTWSGSLGISHSIAKGVGLRAGYRQRSSQYPDSPGGIPGRATSRSIDAGVDFQRTLSFSRRTKLAFNTGSTAVSDASQTRFRIVGSANLSHELGRSWNASLSYLRDVDFVGLVTAPVFLDSVATSISGLFGRRVGIVGAVNASLGSVGAGQAGNGFWSYSGASAVTFGLTRGLGLSVAYAYYGHRFDNSLALVPGLLREVNRQTLSTSLNVLTPLFQRTRRANAAR